jgi:hypothetical protein
MSASPVRFNRVTKSSKPVIQAPTPLGRVTEPDESVVLSPSEEKISDTKLESPPYEAPGTLSKRWPLYFYSWMLLSLLAGVIAGRLLYVLWDRVASHDQQLAWHHAAIQGLTKTRTAISDQANHLKSLDTSVGSVQALLAAQSKRLGDLERGQTEIRDQMNGMNARWQKQMNELRKDKALLAPASIPKASIPKTENPAAAGGLPAAPASPTADKHNETFSPDLKPAPNAYAQMSPSGLVVWMTPRPGFAKPVPTSVIGQVRGLGMLVHDWDDNKHYFITDSGTWLPDQR